ncbi:Uncharacterized protein SCG7086_AG_00290 [Chlamydiales bacterium SCGC AG-110-P3]|nr:Uncharacterized protein SCG7086_AG_00290 [Chlamydiales bacterium SCGC AG-110-P3]
MRYLSLLFIIIVSTACHAQDWDSTEDWSFTTEYEQCDICQDGLYLTSSLGLTIFLDNNGHGPGVSSVIETDRGYLASLALGYHWSDCWAIEVELSRQASDIEMAIINGVSFNAAGHHRVWSVMTNLIYDLNMDLNGFQPYVGMGIGVAHQLLRLKRTGTTDIDDSQNTFALQTLAGLSYPLSPCVDLCFEYRHFLTTDPHFYNQAGTSVQYELSTHSLVVNTRWYF